jgi:hypothetical protein
MAGHGIAPDNMHEPDEKEAALLMGNFDPTNPTYLTNHLPGAYATKWFGNSGCFKEVFLFMDCCRTPLLLQHWNRFFSRAGNDTTAKLFFGFGTKWSRTTREREMPDEKKVRGIFTKTLLLGLSGAAAEPVEGNPKEGVITAASLKGFLIENIATFAGPQFNKEEYEPDFAYRPDGKNGADIIIKTVLLQKFPIIVRITSSLPGKLIIAYNGKEDVSQSFPFTASPGDIRVKLARGIYRARVIVNNEETTNIFKVTGNEVRGKETTIDFNIKSSKHVNRSNKKV